MNLLKRSKVTLTWCVASVYLSGHRKRLASFQSAEGTIILLIRLIHFKDICGCRRVCSILTCSGQAGFHPPVGPWRSWWGVCSGRCEAAGWWAGGSTLPAWSVWFLSTSGCRAIAVLRTQTTNMSWRTATGQNQKPSNLSIDFQSGAEATSVSCPLFVLYKQHGNTIVVTTTGLLFFNVSVFKISLYLYLAALTLRMSLFTGGSFQTVRDAAVASGLRFCLCFSFFTLQHIFFCNLGFTRRMCAVLF